MENERFEELLIRELAGELSVGERQELLDLLQADAGLRGEREVLREFWARKEPDYADMRSTFEKIKAEIRRQENNGEAGEPEAGTREREAAEPDAKDQEPEAETGRRIPVLRRRRVWSAAAALILLLGGYAVFYHAHSGQVTGETLSWQEKYTPRNARSRLTLTDGSIVTLNSDSRLKYPANFGGPVREVYLTGEAYFTIQKDAAHPFIIHTNKMTIRVLGTSFNVRCYPDDDAMETTLIQGSIEVTFPDRPADKIILKPTDKLVLRNDTASLAAKRPEGPTGLSGADGQGNATADSIRGQAGGDGHTKYTLTGLTYYRNQRSTIVETSWMDDKLVFNGEELQEVARKMERWYGVDIVIDKEELKTLPFTGLFQKETIEEALYALQLSEKKLHYTKKDGVIHIY